MKEYEQKKEVLERLSRRIESDEDKRLLKLLLQDIDHYDRITKTSNYFYLNESQAKKAHAFWEKHLKGRNYGTIGGGLYYAFMPTGLGNIVHVLCKGEKGEWIDEDLTETENW